VISHSRTSLVRIASIEDKKTQKEVLEKTKEKSAFEVSKIVRSKKRTKTSEKMRLINEN